MARQSGCTRDRWRAKPRTRIRSLSVVAVMCGAAAWTGTARAQQVTIRVGGAPQAVAADGTHVWVNNGRDRTVSEIEAATATVIRTIPSGIDPYGVASDGTRAWVANGGGGNGDGSVTEIDTAGGSVIGTIPISGSNPHGVAADGKHVWIADAYGGLRELDAVSGALIRTFADVVGFAVASDGTHVWAGGRSGPPDYHETVSEIDSATGG